MRMSAMRFDDIPDPDNQEVIAFEDPYEMPSNLVLWDQGYHTKVWKTMLGDAADEKKPAANRIPIDAVDERKPATK